MSQRDIYTRRVIQILLGIDCIPRNHKEKLALIEVQVHINRDRGTGVAGVALATPRFLNLLYKFF